MPNGKVSIDISDDNAFRGYVIGKLEDIYERTNRTNDRVEKLDEKVDAVNDAMPSPQDVEHIKKTLYGNGKEGLVIEVKKLKLSHKIKSSWYGVSGGGGFSAMLALLYLVLRGKV